MRQIHRSFREAYPLIGVVIASMLAAGGIMWFFDGSRDISSFFTGWALGVFSGAFLYAVWPR
ncbi:MAG: hypothetical protein M0Z41_01325 [Peptococcaceae bacterium]|jgi:hypothetical protein|nr:hypothetical protein [Peptococcaceae bacterium]